MRTIKFRAWDGTKINYNPNVSTYDAGVNDEFYYAQSNQSELIFMQYTGLKDKNNIDIYECDLMEDSQHGMMEVFFIDGKFILMWADNGTYYCDLNEVHQLLYVNGNKFKNTKLKKEK